MSPLYLPLKFSSNPSSNRIFASNSSGSGSESFNCSGTFRVSSYPATPTVFYPNQNSSVAAGHSDSLHKAIAPHARTLRNAREQVKQMVIDGVSLRRIKRYLSRWCAWWVRTAENWQYQELIGWFIQACRDAEAKNIVATILRERLTSTNHENLQASLSIHATA
jgi:hypothetical protein